MQVMDVEEDGGDSIVVDLTPEAADAPISPKQVIVYKNAAGLPVVVAPTQEAVKALGIEAIGTKDVPTGTAFKIMDADDLPADLTVNWLGDEELTDGVGEAEMYGEPVPILSPDEELAAAKARAKDRAVEWIEQFLGRFTEGYPTLEVQAWPSKLAAARKFLEDGTVGEILSFEAQLTGEAVGDLVPVIVAKGTLLENIAGKVSGMRRNLWASIDGLTDASDLPDLLEAAMLDAEEKLAEVLSHGG
jgi:hypothetical protein